MNIRSHSRRGQRNPPRLGAPCSLYRCHVVLLARLGRELRYVSSIRARAGRLQRHSQSLGSHACLGSSALRFHAAVGAPQSGPRRTLAGALGRRRRRHCLRIPAAWAISDALCACCTKWLRAHPERSPEQAAAMWYRRMSRVLARRGVEKPAAQTPQEFVRKIEDTRLREPVARFTNAYEPPPRRFRRRREAPA